MRISTARDGPGRRAPQDDPFATWKQRMNRERPFASSLDHGSNRRPIMTAHFYGRMERSICAGAALTLALATSPALASGPQALCKTYKPIEAMTKDLGSKSALAYFVSQDGACSVVMMISEKFDPVGPATPSAARVCLLLPAGQNVSMDSEDGGSLNIECGRDATSMRVTTGSRDEIMELQQKAGFSLCAMDAAK
jgi:hypothetical protein